MFVPNWKVLKANYVVLSWVQGFKIPFVKLPYQNLFDNFQPKFSKTEELQIKVEVHKLIIQGAIEQCMPCKGQFISSYFLVNKPNGKKRFILNLKSLNTFLNPPHFKMEDGRTLGKLIHKNSLLTKIDLKDAYFSVPVANEHRKYLRFVFNNTIYQFCVLPFGLSYAPYLFTKLIKPILTHFRSQGISCVAYIDDWILIHDSLLSAYKNTNYVRQTLEKLGFTINLEKSCLTPQTKCQFLGFIYNTQNMTLKLPQDKGLKILKDVRKLKNLNTCKIRFLAHVAGLLVSACPAVKYGKMYTKMIEREKFLALKRTKGDFDKEIEVSVILKKELVWWEANILGSQNNICSDTICLEIYTDASKSGWGAVCNKDSTHGWWNNSEQKLHINILELKAILFALKCFANNLTSVNILLRVDNTTAISYINRMGSVQHMALNEVAREIWQWCEARNLWLVASYIKSKNNRADKDSRILSTETEWELDNSAFNIITKTFGQPEIDLFASRINAKCVRYISWYKDPGSEVVDAFTITWTNFKFYAFPPFSLILRVINKIVADKAEGIIVVPNWCSQPWYPLYLKLLVGKPIIFEPDYRLLHSPFRSRHPLHHNLTLVAAKLSAKLLG